MITRLWKNVGMVVCAASILVVMGAALSADGAEGTKLVFDRAKIHALAVEDSLKPIRPGIPGKVLFWNSRATSFIYAPAFDFKPVPGATAYRFTLTAYGPDTWTFNDTTAQASLAPVWKELPEGKLLVSLAYYAKYNNRDRWYRSRQRAVWLEKKADAPAPTLSFNKEEKSEEKDGGQYRFTIKAVKELVFEADTPFAALSPVWNDVPHGKVSLTVVGLDAKDGKEIAVAQIKASRGTSMLKTRQFEKRAVFNGPYHEAAMDYAESGKRWFATLEEGHYRKWGKGERDPQRLGHYPCKVEAAETKGATTMAVLESDPAKKKELLQMARNAARTLIKGSYPADWGLAGLPPTYGSRKPGPLNYGTVLMTYPADAGDAYLDLYEATKEKEFLDAVVRIADVYKRTQQANGAWPVLMEGKTGKKTERSKTDTMTTVIITLLGRLVNDHGLTAYQPVIDAGWKWLQDDVLPEFRFEGQFEDTVAGRGGVRWHVTHHAADKLVWYLLKYRKDDPASIPLAEQIIRWSEDQFVFWEVPGGMEKAQVQFCPRGVEQHGGALEYTNRGYSTEPGSWIKAYQALYEATGKELYLAKAIAFANAMTVLQKVKHHGRYVSTDWGWGTGWGGWVNCHTFNAATMSDLGRFLKERNWYVTVNPDAKIVDVGSDLDNRH